MEALVQREIRDEWQRDLRAVIAGCDPYIDQPRLPVKLADRAYTVKDIRAAVARIGRVSVDEMLSRRRNARFTQPRLAATYLIHKLFPRRSFPSIGLVLERDHTTIMYRLREAEQLMESDPDFRELVNDARAAVVDA